MRKKGPKVYQLDEARVKIQRYCAYQERAHSEVEDKLRSFGLTQLSIDTLIVELLQENFLNEERFARAYTSGKFRIKGWGRKKIKLGLKEKKVTPKCIELGLSEISDEEYLQGLRKLLQQKRRRTTAKNEFELKGKVAKYAISRGFESDLVWDVLKELFEEEDV